MESPIHPTFSPLMKLSPLINSPDSNLPSKVLGLASITDLIAHRSCHVGASGSRRRQAAAGVHQLLSRVPPSQPWQAWKRVSAGLRHCDFRWHYRRSMEMGRIACMNDGAAHACMRSRSPFPPLPSTRIHETLHHLLSGPLWTQHRAALETWNAHLPVQEIRPSLRCMRS